jgi:SAM-dependent methyltransferase
VPREQRLVFGEVAETYERARPGYPDELVDDVLAWAGLSAGGRALEIGAGTGKATTAFAARGLELVCLEPSEEMAAVARRKLAPFPRTRLVVASFENYEPDAARFDLVFSAQAWHWIDERVRCRRAHDALREGGALATFWNTPVWEEDTELRRALDALYEARAPTLHARAPGCPGLSRRSGSAARPDEQMSELERSGLFADMEKRTYAWAEACGSARYLDLLRTQSDHRMLDEATRRHLLDGVREVIDGAGGVIALHYNTELYLGRRA